MESIETSPCHVVQLFYTYDISLYVYLLVFLSYSFSLSLFVFLATPLSAFLAHTRT